MGKLLIMQETVNKLSEEKFNEFTNDPNVVWEEKLAKKSIKYYVKGVLEEENVTPVDSK